MVARRRREHETHSVYRANPREEARAEKVKIKGRWVWRSFIVHPNDEGEMVVTKMPPYRRPDPVTGEQT